MSFNATKYRQDMERLMQQALTETLSFLYTSYRNKLQANTINELDVKHLGEMVGSVTAYKLPIQEGLSRGVVGVGNRGSQNNAFKAVYYEYGTGDLAQYPTGYSPSSDPYRNPARGNSKAFHYWKDGHQDMGGNFRRGTGKSHEIPRTIGGKPNPYATPIQPHKNMFMAALEAKVELAHSLQRAVIQMNPISYTSLRGIHVRA